jgi:hypothetical protein
MSNQIRKSQEQIAFKEKNEGRPSKNNRYLSVGFYNAQDCYEVENTAGEVSTNGDTCLSNGATSGAFKKSDASSFTQISSDGFQKQGEESVQGLATAALRREGVRIGEQADKRR